MLHYKTVDEKLYTTLKAIMEIPALKDFHLAGGTNLSLMYGHRKSIDIDLWKEQYFDNEELESILYRHFQREVFTNIRRLPFGIMCTINNIKADFISWNDPFIEEPLLIDGIRFLHKTDLFAMKLNAIAGRASKKDFLDIAEMLNDYSLEEGIRFFKQKYFQQDEVMVLKRITDFNQADTEISPVLFNPLSWEIAKDKLVKAFDDYMNNLTSGK